MKRTLLVLGGFALLLAACGTSGSSSQQQETTTVTTSTPSANKMLPGEKLIAKADCIGCHNKTVKVVGPSYVEIASKYEASDENIEKLAVVIISGGKGNWGEVPMTPHANLSKEDAKEMVTWILSLRK